MTREREVAYMLEQFLKPIAEAVRETTYYTEAQLDTYGIRLTMHAKKKYSINRIISFREIVYSNMDWLSHVLNSMSENLDEVIKNGEKSE